MYVLLFNILSFFGIGIEVYFIVAFLATPFFFLWRRLFRKVFNSTLKVALASCLTAFITAPLAYATLVVAAISVANYYPKNKFSRAQWFAEKEKRYKLSGDIIESRMLIGKSKKEVKELLGKDEMIDERSDYWEYGLGFVPSGSIDPDALDIYFQDGKVIKVSQHET